MVLTCTIFMNIVIVAISNTIHDIDIKIQHNEYKNFTLSHIY